MNARNARLVICLVVAVIAAVVGTTFVRKEGDPWSVADIDHKLDAAFQRRDLLVERDVDRAGETATFKTYKVTSPDGRVLEIQYDRAPSEGDLDKIFAQLASRETVSTSGLTGSLKKVTQITPAWSELEPIWHTLAWSNQNVATAKALLRLQEKPTDITESMWDQRFVVAAWPWQIEQAYRLAVRKGGAAAGAAIAGLLFAFIAVTFITWVWYFLLARIRELSAAVRGK